MNIQYPTGSMNQPLDRNPVMKFLEGAAVGVGPHTPTQRASYTVPAGKKAMLNALQLDVIRATAATTAGPVSAYVNFLIGGGGNNSIGPTMYKNAINDSDLMRLSIGVVMSAGDALRVYTADGSTGGTVTYAWGAILTEYDA